MLLRLPRNLHYPITITKVLKRSGSNVVKNEPVFLYTYETTVREGSRDGEDKYVKKSFPATFESGLEGQLKFWKVKDGETVDQPVDIAEIEEECAHAEQFAGMCTNCGKDMTIVSSFNDDVNDVDRAPLQTSHDTLMLRISQREASKREEEAKRRLLASKKLSLVVDLDQTIIHAAVDPTIAEWQKDQDNPNYEAVKDVRAFQLMDDTPGMRGCWYYIKLRPGLQEFLEQISQIFELHIYTMGTRQYAEQVANIVDPKRSYFGDRILSRDESGSATNKNLERLFPIDTKMVVIIDDRGDVWNWNPNLIRVIPFDFFVGIGDINSSFLPKKQEIKVSPKGDQADDDAKPEPTSTIGEDAIEDVNRVPEAATNKPTTSGTGNDPSALEQLVAMGAGDDPLVREIQSKDQEETIVAQLEEKPLLQMQKLLDAKDQAAAEAEAEAETEVEAPVAEDNNATSVLTNGDALDSKAESEPSSSSTTSEAADTSAAPSSKPPPVRHSLLRDDDRELASLSSRLTAVHAAFYAEYDRQRLRQKGGRVAALSGRGGKIQFQSDPEKAAEDASDLLLVPDIKAVMPAMKQRVLAGVTIVFSGILPLDTNVQTADISLWAKTFGGTIAEKVSTKATHVVAARVGTSKVKQAVKKGLWVVSLQWLIDCMTGWKRVSEDNYVLADLPVASKNNKKKQRRSLDKGEGGDDRTQLREDSRGLLLLSSDEGEGETTGIDTEAESEDKRAAGRTGDAVDPQPSRKRLKLETNNLTDDDAMMTDNDDAVNGALANASPLSLNQDEWEDMDKELKEFMGSDDDEEIGSDTASESSYTGVRKSGKRKREDGDEESSFDSKRPSSIPGSGDSSIAEASMPLIVVNANGTDSNDAIGDDTDADADTDADTDVDFRHAQLLVENAERQEEADQLDSDDELARELEREFERSSGDDEEGFMGDKHASTSDAGD